MRKTKYAMPCFAFYDRTSIEEYLEHQARQGWLLEKSGNNLWKFRRIEPQNLRFTVTYFPKADLFDPAPSEEEETFRDFCAHSGWTLAASNAQLQIFYTAEENPVPIETDPVMEVENIHKSVKKSMLPGYWVLIANAILQGVVQTWSFSNDGIRWVSQNLSLFFGLFWIVLLAVCLSRVVMYHRWHKRAMEAAEDGIFLKPKSFAKVETGIMLGLLAMMIFLVATMGDRERMHGISFGMVSTFLVIILTSRFREKLKRDGYDAKTNKIVSLLVCVAVAFGITMIGTPLMMSWVEDDDPKNPEVPLSMAQLLGADDYTTLTMYDQESLLLGYLDVFQVPEGVVTIPRLEYELVEVKAGFLYDWCLKQMLEDPYRGEYRPTDAVSWGAVEAYQLWDEGEAENGYLLCYDRYLLEIIPSWDMTADQMAMIGDLFG